MLLLFCSFFVVVVILRLLLFGLNCYCYKMLSWAIAGYWRHFCFTAWISVRRPAAESCLIIRVRWRDWRLSELIDIRQPQQRRTGVALSSSLYLPIRRRRRCDWSHKWILRNVLTATHWAAAVLFFLKYFRLVLVEIWYQSVKCWECDTPSHYTTLYYTKPWTVTSGGGWCTQGGLKKRKKKRKIILCCLHPTRRTHK